MNEPDALMEAENRRLRASIFRARETAHRRACTYWSFDAGSIANTASHIAAEWAFKRSASLEEIEGAIGAVTHLLIGAELLERLEAPDE
jgi:hypothetical protein